WRPSRLRAPFVEYQASHPPRCRVGRLVLDIAGEQSHMDQRCQRAGVHFRHDPGAMNFYCALTDSELVRDDLIGRTARYELEHVMLASRERVQPPAHRLVTAQLLADGVIFGEGPLHPIQQILVAERL